MVLPLSNELKLLVPETVKDALKLLDQHADHIRILAGGTDMLPNLKHGLYDETHLLSLHRLCALDGIEMTPDHFVFGARITLETLGADSRVRALLPAVADAALSVAGPQLRAAGTLGGNLCLDTRCVYINQTHFWRSALGYCLKKDGDQCHVVKSGKRCVAAASNDTATILISLDAEVALQSVSGTRWVSLRKFYRSDGVWNKVMARNELLTKVRVSMSATHCAMSYQKLRRRGSIDFPWVSLGLSYKPTSFGGEDLSVVVSAIAAKPKLIRLSSQLTDLTEAGIASVAQRVFDQVRPLSNIDADIDWRRAMSRTLTLKAFEEAMSRSPLP
jgi:4-hydroxybenzoyl-CoA reductase subunit beta